MTQFCQGDERAFDELFSRHAPDVHAFLARMLGGRAAADDGVQLTFLSVVRSRHRFRDGARFRPWLFAIAANAARDHLRQRRRERQHDAQWVAEAESVEPAHRDPALARRLEEALARLSPPLREAVVLHHVLGWSFDEIAEALQTSEGAARLRAHRGYALLRPILEPLRESP